MKTLVIFLIIHLVFNYGQSAASDSTTSKKPFIDALWMEGGPGLSTIDLGGGASVNLIMGQRIILSANRTFNFTFMKAMPENLADYSLSAGFLFVRSKDLIISGSGGFGKMTHKSAVQHLRSTSLFSGEYIYESKSSYNVPLNLKLIYLPNSIVNFGWNIFYHINEVKNYTGIMGTIGIGFIERKRYGKIKMFPFNQ